MSGMQDYFTGLSQALDDAGAHTPSLIIDLDRLDANAQRIGASVPAGSVRLVDKSLPSAGLLYHIAEAVGTRRFMSFHEPFIIETARHFPDASILLGKPLPPPVVEAVFASLGGRPGTGPGSAFDPARQIVWLIDTPEQAQAYAGVAARLGVRLPVALEVDIGLHRGGAQTLEAFDALLDDVLLRTETLKLAGLMGYDAHVGAASKAKRSPTKALERANAAYWRFLARVTAHPSGVTHTDDLLLNGSGSQTILMHGDNTPLNDFAVGSAFVKPTDFDQPSLEAFSPAAFIATPVLKRQRGVAVPFIEALTAWTMAGRDALFLYGGRWMAQPVWPEGMRINELYGLSSNQQMMTVPTASPVAPGDWAFFRPTQSEAVLLQFGALWVYQGGRIIGRWPVYREEPEGLAPGERFRTVS